MLLVKVVDGIVTKFPYTPFDLRQDHPNVSFPMIISPETATNYDAYPVVFQDYPTVDERTQRLIVGVEPVLLDGVWTLTRTVVDKTAEEIVEYDNALATQLRTHLIEAIDLKTDSIIITSFMFNTQPVRLNDIDQRNFEGEYRQIKDFIEDGVPESSIFPTSFNVWTENDGSPVFLPFTTFAELKNFIYGAKMFIKECLTAGWVLKSQVCTMPLSELQTWTDPR